MLNFLSLNHDQFFILLISRHFPICLTNSLSQNHMAVQPSHWLINHNKTNGSSRSSYRPRMYVRREVMFSRVCVCSTFGGGTPSQGWPWGDAPSQVWPRGYPIPGLTRGVPHPSSGGIWGTPLTRSGWGTPPDIGWGTPLTRSGWGTPPDLGQGTPQTWDGVPPGPGMGYPPDLGQGIPLDLAWGTLPDLGWGTPPGHGMGFPPDLGWGTPRPGTGYPPPTRSGLDRAAQRVLTTWWAVCLLCSRRRTFLLVVSLKLI